MGPANAGEPGVADDVITHGGEVPGSQPVDLDGSRDLFTCFVCFSGEEDVGFFAGGDGAAHGGDDVFLDEFVEC